VLRELSVTEQRYQAVLEVLREQVAVVEVAARYGVTRKRPQLGGRYLQGGLEGLADRPDPHGLVAIAAARPRGPAGVAVRPARRRRVASPRIAGRDAGRRRVAKVGGSGCWNGASTRSGPTASSTA
jgi:transposase-like protein